DCSIDALAQALLGARANLARRLLACALDVDGRFERDDEALDRVGTFGLIVIFAAGEDERDPSHENAQQTGAHTAPGAATLAVGAEPPARTSSPNSHRHIQREMSGSAKGDAGRAAARPARVMLQVA